MAISVRANEARNEPNWHILRLVDGNPLGVALHI